jgi:hypothetical protein
MYPAVKIPLLPFLGLSALLLTPLPADVELDYPAEPSQVAVAGQAIDTALDTHAETADGFAIKLALRAKDGLANQLSACGANPVRQLKPEGFSIRLGKPDGGLKPLWVIGEDPAGIFYGALELAERIRTNSLAGVSDSEHEPHMAMRGIKFNIPLDVRTPSYTDPCDSAQNNIGEVWTMEFWKPFIDELSSHRYNFVSMWNLHPFPSMVKVPDYPDVALDDVQRSKVDWEEFYSGTGTGFCEPEIINNVETLHKMTIAEKMDFWREVMAYGAERNVHFYVVTWNQFTYGAEGKHGITCSLENETTTDYFRKSVTAMFREYPLLAGIGLTTGENMHKASFKKKEDWAFDTYGKGVLDAAKEMPDRHFTLIHRQHQAAAREIAETFQPLVAQPNADLLFSFKYAKAHVMSSTRQTYHPKFVEDLGDDLKTIWTLRNDDAYHYRWAAPDFVREFIRNIPYDVSRGFYYGSDQWIWGREFLSNDPESPRLLEVEKHWFHWLLWGRLGYDPKLTNERLVAILGARFPGVDAQKLFDAWQAASMTYPLTTGFHWGALDFQWYIEGCISRPHVAKTKSGFHDINRFISLKPHPGTDNISIPDYVKAKVAGKKPDGITPPEVARELHDNAKMALALSTAIDPGNDRELKRTLSDIKSMALLGKYYSQKIEGATALALFRKTGNKTHQEAAHCWMSDALETWREYAALAASKYKNPLWTNRVGHVDWRELDAEVARDIEIVKKAAKEK